MGKGYQGTGHVRSEIDFKADFYWGFCCVARFCQLVFFCDFCYC